MREREASVFAGSDCRRHARHDLEIDVGGSEGGRLFAAAAEDERIAPLEPHDGLAGGGGLDQPSIDFVLPASGPRIGCRLDAAGPLGLGRGQPQEREDSPGRHRGPVGLLQAAQPFDRERPGSPGPAPTR